MSYRIQAELKTENQEPDADSASVVLGSQFSVLLQGWGVFDNQLDEDLEDVMLTLVAGMPVSFGLLHPLAG